MNITFTLIESKLKINNYSGKFTGGVRLFSIRSREIVYSLYLSGQHFTRELVENFLQGFLEDIHKTISTSSRCVGDEPARAPAIGSGNVERMYQRTIFSHGKLFSILLYELLFNTFILHCLYF